MSLSGLFYICYHWTSTFPGSNLCIYIYTETSLLHAVVAFTSQLAMHPKYSIKSGNMQEATQMTLRSPHPQEVFFFLFSFSIFAM